MRVLAVERVAAGDGRVSALVRVTDPRFMRTAAVPGLTGRVASLLPGLARHRCESGHARGVLSELADTETPHLLEHVAIELMALAGAPRTTRGLTEWDFARDGRGVFRVRIETDRPAEATAALEEAAAVVEWLMTEAGDEPDVAAAAARVTARGRTGGVER